MSKIRPWIQKWLEIQNWIKQNFTQENLKDKLLIQSICRCVFQSLCIQDVLTRRTYGVRVQVNETNCLFMIPVKNGNVTKIPGDKFLKVKVKVLLRIFNLVFESTIETINQVQLINRSVYPLRQGASVCNQLRMQILNLASHWKSNLVNATYRYNGSIVTDESVQSEAATRV